MAQRSRAAIRRTPKRNVGSGESTAAGNLNPENGIDSIGGGDDESIIIVDPEEARSGGTAEGDASTSAEGRRGRTPGSKNRPKTAKVDIAGVEKLLFSIHTLLASGLKTPELALDENEAKELAAATAAVAAYYPVAIDPKTLAWGNLMLVAGAIYGTRTAAIWVRKKNEAAAPQSRGDNVHDFPIGGVQAGPLPPFKA